jgi:hypothetical protein
MNVVSVGPDISIMGTEQIILRMISARVLRRRNGPSYSYRAQSIYAAVGPCPVTHAY